MAAEVSSAGWRKPVGEQYPALGLLERFVAGGVPLTTASDAHRLEHVADRADDLRAVLGAAGAGVLQGYRGRTAVRRSPVTGLGRGGGLMPTPAELALSHTDLKPEELEHLQRLLGSWSVLADLSFSDLLLLVPVHAAGERRRRRRGRRRRTDPADEDPELVVLGQMRPNNRPTLVDQDLVGQTVNESQWTLVAQCLHSGEIVRGSIHHPILGEQVPVENIPVRFDGHIIGALLRVSLAPLKGPTSMYERTYLDVFERLADMVAQSAFPFPDEDVGTEESPRVGDGVVVVDADGRVEFASPNAMNAFHRMGIYTQPEGRRFGDLDVEESAVEWALATGRPVVEEVERRPDVIVLVHCIPLLSHGVVTGAMILLRDVTDVRRLDRLLLSKDAAIREVHHRVKNNLQTISSLLSLQARRVGDRAARVALHEAERRVRSIALGARDPVAGPERPGALRRDRQLAGADGRGLGGLVAADRDLGARGPRRGGGRRGHAARRDGGRAPAERGRARLRPRERRRAGRGGRVWRVPGEGRATRRWATSTSRCPTTSRRCGSRCATTGWGCPRGSTSSGRRASGCRSCATSSSVSWRGRSPWSRCRRPTGAGPASPSRCRCAPR